MCFVSQIRSLIYFVGFGFLVARYINKRDNLYHDAEQFITNKLLVVRLIKEAAQNLNIPTNNITTCCNCPKTNCRMNIYRNTEHTLVLENEDMGDCYCGPTQ